MNKKDISKRVVSLSATQDDLKVGARYAAVALPWTFNRMMLNTNSRGQNSRAMNIVKGVVGQEILRRWFKDNGIKAPVQQKSHRDEDLFDFIVELNGEQLHLDVKTMNYYSDYEVEGRAPFSTQLLERFGDYHGPEWRCFFPMLLPHTQISQNKDAYLFAIAESIDFRSEPSKNRESCVLSAFPSGALLPFMSGRKLVAAREEANKGFYLKLEWQQRSLFEPATILIEVVGEWAGELKNKSQKVSTGKPVIVGPFSCVNSFLFDGIDPARWGDGRVEISVSKNDLVATVFNSTMKNINNPTGELIIGKNDVCNLILPSDYTVHFIGLSTKPDFLDNCRKYDGYVWPNDRVDKGKNQTWSMVTDDDKVTLTRAGFGDCLRPDGVKAGWLKTTGKGSGACCYVYPNVFGSGGVSETNLYVLPVDLQPISAFLGTI